MQFQFGMPTDIYFGRGAVRAHAEALRLGKRAYIITGKTSGRSSGALRDVTEALRSGGIAYDVFEGIGNNPLVEQCYQLGAQVRRAGADFIIGIGGGSPLDAAKAIAVYAANDIPPERIFSYGYDNGVLPILAVPTTSGTGSEVTPWSILTDDAKQTKRSFGGPLTFPKAAFLDPAYTDSLPADATRNTALDALQHCIEGVFSLKASPYSDALALDAIRRFGACMPALERGDFAPIRDALMLISMMAGTVIANTGTTLMHAMGYSLTYFYDVPHGLANALVMPVYMAEMQRYRPDAMERVLGALGMSQADLAAYLKRSFKPSFTPRPGELAKWAALVTEAAAGVKAAGLPVEQSYVEDLYRRAFE
ncbi:MAG: iron-containing alcohol dehydrogenase [Christensenellaceae bacterium]|jgi:alcohol dehydrogenase class IV|nr:iron-containing alcohol dehydrogenase [Christensenellaceae bacterium]